MMDGLLIINKPKGWTSHDVVAKVRGILSGRKAGHTGTLDPDATGVLCVCIGKGTRLAQYTAEFDKEYRVVMKLGEATDTQDATGKVIRETKDFEIPESGIREAFGKFTGRIKQTPPMYSAVKVGGVPLYKLARKGKEVSRAPREIEIREIRLLDYSGPLVSFDVVCSKGTYIRTLCTDIGDYLGVGAHMRSLERLRSGEYSIRDAVTVEEAEGLCRSGMLESRLIPLVRMVAWLPSVELKTGGDEGVRHGRGVLPDSIAGVTGDLSVGKTIRVLSSEGELLAIGTSLGKNVFKIEKVLV